MNVSTLPLTKLGKFVTDSSIPILSYILYKKEKGDIGHSKNIDCSSSSTEHAECQAFCPVVRIVSPRSLTRNVQDVRHTRLRGKRCRGSNSDDEVRDTGTHVSYCIIPLHSVPFSESTSILHS